MVMETGGAPERASGAATGSPYELTRRRVLKGGGAALAGLAVLRLAGAAPAGAARQGTATVIDWLDQPAPNPVPDVVGHPLVWEELDSRFTPPDEFFTVKHYEEPAIDPATWRLTVDGLVKTPLELSLADLMAMPRHEVEFTLECSGNTGLPFFIGGIGNNRWRGTPLNRVLKRAGVLDEAVDLVFWGEDSGEVTVVGGWNVDPNDPDGGPGTPMTFTEQFARSMSVADAMASENLLCWGMGEHETDMLTPEHGAPVRLIAPGWYGVANVKWLTRIEAVDQRFAGRFMARDYVTIRNEEVDGELVHTFATVGHDRLKSAPARVVQLDDRYTVEGVAWGAPIKRVEVSIDGGAWTAARLATPSKPGAGYAWTMWTYPWDSPSSGSHTVTSRAWDRYGNVQPDPEEDPFLAAKLTYWESNGQITRTVVDPVGGAPGRPGPGARRSTSRSVRTPRRAPSPTGRRPRRCP